MYKKKTVYLTGKIKYLDGAQAQNIMTNINTCLDK